MHGYPLLPDRPLPRDEAGYVAEVARMLTLAKLSIHLVGTSYGAVPDGPTQKSIVVLQNELAVARSQSAGLRRVISLREGTESQHPEQQQFIERLHRDAETQLGADLLICDHETLKGAIHTTLESLQRLGSAPTPVQHAAERSRLVYVICDPRDRKATIPLRKFLKAHGLEVQVPVFDGDARHVRQANHDLLTQCDAVIVFYGAGDESWKRTVENDLRKLKADRRDNPLLGAYTFLSEPATDDKREVIEMEEPHLVNGLDGFSDAVARPLLAILQDA